MKILFIFAGILILLLILALFYKYYKVEGFENVTGTVEEDIIRIYNTVLQRDPSIIELKARKEELDNKTINLYKLGILLFASDEYSRNVKMQSNTVAPELMKMIAEREYINKLNDIFKSVFGKPIPTTLVLPYYDLYVHKFNTQDALFERMLKDARYTKFEKEILTIKDLDRDVLFDIYDRIYQPKDGEIFTTAEPPQANYIPDVSSIVNDASRWTIPVEELTTEIIPPWKSPDQEEFTYSRTKDEQPDFQEPVNMKNSVFASTTPATPVDANQPLPTPKDPLQPERIGTNLSTTAITAESTEETEEKFEITPDMYIGSPDTLDSVIVAKPVVHRQVSGVDNTTSSSSSLNDAIDPKTVPPPTSLSSSSVEHFTRSKTNESFVTSTPLETQISTSQDLVRSTPELLTPKIEETFDSLLPPTIPTLKSPEFSLTSTSLSTGDW